MNWIKEGHKGIVEKVQETRFHTGRHDSVCMYHTPTPHCVAIPYFYTYGNNLIPIASLYNVDHSAILHFGQAHSLLRYM